MKLDPNLTVWQRIQRAIDESEVLTDEHDARALTSALHPYVLAERANAKENS